MAIETTPPSRDGSDGLPSAASGGKFTHQYKEWQETSGIIYTLHTWRMRGALPNVEAILLLPGYAAMTRSAYQRRVPKLNYETNKFRWTE